MQGKRVLYSIIKIVMMVILFITISGDFYSVFNGVGFDRFWPIMSVLWGLVGMCVGAYCGSKLFEKRKVPSWIPIIVNLILTIICSIVIKLIMLWIYRWLIAIFATVAVVVFFVILLIIAFGSVYYTAAEIRMLPSSTVFRDQYGNEYDRDSVEKFVENGGKVLK